MRLRAGTIGVYRRWIACRCDGAGGASQPDSKPGPASQENRWGEGKAIFVHCSDNDGRQLGQGGGRPRHEPVSRQVRGCHWGPRNHATLLFLYKKINMPDTGTGSSKCRAALPALALQDAQCLFFNRLFGNQSPCVHQPPYPGEPSAFLFFEPPAAPSPSAASSTSASSIIRDLAPAIVLPSLVPPTAASSAFALFASLTSASMLATRFAITPHPDAGFPPVKYLGRTRVRQTSDKLRVRCPVEGS